MFIFLNKVFVIKLIAKNPLIVTLNTITDY
jgi:hypothetical protein